MGFVEFVWKRRQTIVGCTANLFSATLQSHSIPLVEALRDTKAYLVQRIEHNNATARMP